MKAIGNTIIATAAVIALTMLAACGTKTTAEPTPAPPKTSATPTATPSPVTEREKAIAGATAAFERYQKVTNALYEKPDTTSKELATVAKGTALLDTQQFVSEYVKNGWHSIGQPTVTGIKVVDAQLDKKVDVPTVIFEVCLDATTAHIVDKNGKSVPADRPNPRPKIRYGVSNYKYPDASSWIVTYRVYDGKPSCK